MKDEGMGDAPEIDVEQLMDRIRENIRQKRRGAGPAVPEDVTSPFDDGQGPVDLAYLHSGFDIQNIPFASHRAVFGSLVIGLKKMLRKLLTPILQRQVAYNAANARATTYMKEWIERVERHQAKMFAAAHNQTAAQTAALQAQIETLRAAADKRMDVLERDVERNHAEVGEEHAKLGSELDGLRKAGRQSSERIAGAERKLRRILHAPPPTHGPDGPAPPAPSFTDVEFDYAGFEDRFRGSEEEIKERQRIYVPYFEGRQNVLDIGCGRGEFLELLRETGIESAGVDLDLDMVLLCREKGLNAGLGDAFAHLGALPDDSLGGVFAAQIIEHLSPRRIIELVKLCHRKLAPGGILVFETPNPKCLMVFTDFSKDPSHVHLAHPDTMEFLLEATGFRQIEVKFLGAVDPVLRIPHLQIPGADLERFNCGIERVNALLYGFRDYAVIGRKGHASP